MLGPVPFMCEGGAADACCPSLPFESLPEFDCGEMSPRGSSGASSSSEAFPDFLRLPLGDGALSPLDHALPPQSADAEMCQHLQQPYWPQLSTTSTQGRLPLVTLEDRDDDLRAVWHALVCQQHPPALPAAPPPPPKDRRRVGRPRAAGAAAAAAPAKDAAGAKRPRGPKPKYVFATPDEALDARKERNRKAALESYYRKRQRTEEMEEEVRRLEAENAALEKLVAALEAGEERLAEPTDAGINAWLGGQPGVPAC